MVEYLRLCAISFEAPNKDNQNHNSGGNKGQDCVDNRNKDSNNSAKLLDTSSIKSFTSWYNGNVACDYCNKKESCFQSVLFQTLCSGEPRPRKYQVHGKRAGGVEMEPSTSAKPLVPPDIALDVVPQGENPVIVGRLFLDEDNKDPLHSIISNNSMVVTSSGKTTSVEAVSEASKPYVCQIQESAAKDATSHQGSVLKGVNVALPISAFWKNPQNWKGTFFLFFQS